MKLRNISIKTLGALKDVELDLTACEGVVAIAARNGQGKSTLMGAMGPGVLFREIPCHDPATLTAERLHTVFEHDGHTHEVTLETPTKGRPRARISRDGKSVKGASGSVSAYDAIIETIVQVPKPLFYATYFSEQEKTGAFYKLDRASRRRMFRDMLGLDGLQLIGDEAKRRIGLLGEAAAKVEWIEGEIAKAAEAADVVGPELKEAQVRLERAEAEFDGAGNALRAALASRANAGALEELECARDKAAQLRERLDEGELPDRGFAAMVAPLRERVEACEEKARDAAKLDAEIERLEGEFDRALEDVNALETVPCGGKGKFIECKFLCRAKEAAGALLDLRRELPEKLNAAVDVDEITVRCNEAKELLSEASDEVRYAERYDAHVEALDEVNAAIERIQKRLPPDACTDLVGVTEFREIERRQQSARRERDMASGLVARLEARGEELLERGRSLGVELKEAKAATADREPLRLLQRAFATDGIQAHEIEVARPRIEELANSLIGPCYDERFRIELRTQREKKTGGKTEDFDLIVFDNDRGEYTTLRGISGGEKTVVGEAFAIAVSIFNAEHNGTKFDTLWRDERTDSLDAENAARYVEMLRTAREVGGFAHIFFSTHVEHCIDAADFVIRLGDGTARIER